MDATVNRDGEPDSAIDMGLVAAAVARRTPRILLVTVLLCALAYTVLMFVPRLYESTALILVEPRANAFTRATTDVNGSMFLVDDAQIASQIALIRSRATLLEAIEMANLRGHDDFPETDDGRLLAAVSERLVVARERDSRLVAIAFRSTDPDLAAAMANAIARVHVQRRAGQQVADTVEASVWLEREISRMREQVVAAERRVAEFRVENDLFTGLNNTSLLDQQLSDLSSQISAAAERRNAAQSRAQLIRGLLESGQSVSGVADVQASAVVQQLSQEIARLQGERAQRSATLLSNHPTIRALDAQIGEMNAQIAAEGRRVADALEAQARIEADIESAQRAELETLKLQAESATLGSVSLAELEREATAQRELLNAYLIRYSEAAARTESSSTLPDVRIVSEAAPSGAPASPRTALILIALGLASVILQVGAIIFSELLSGRAIVERRPAREVEPEPRSEEDAAVKAVLAEPPPPAAPKPYFVPLEVEREALAAEILSGRRRLVAIASLSGWRDSAAFAESLSARIVENGQSVVEIDAASGQEGAEPGLVDLVRGAADFGDVVHSGADGRFGMVPWGQVKTLDRRSDRPLVLLEALADLYEAVIVVTGKPGMASSLPLFAGQGGCCILLGPEGAERDAAVAEIEALGFDPVRAIGEPEPQPKVA